MGFSCSCLAKVDYKTTKRLVIPVDNVTPKMTKEDVAKVVPLDMEAGCSAGTVLTRIADRGISLWFNSAAMKQTRLGQIAEETQEKLKTDVVMAPTEKGGVSHKFSFRVEALQALAKLEYEGWMRAGINYDAKDSATNIHIKENVFHNKELIVSHKGNHTEALSMVALGWSW